jgi:hypothetical protein
MLVPLHLLIWACETALTTLTCLVEAMSWEGFTGQEKVALAQIYGPYLLLGKEIWKSPWFGETVELTSQFCTAMGMGADMFLRLKRQLTGKAKKA